MTTGELIQHLEALDPDARVVAATHNGLIVDVTRTLNQKDRIVLGLGVVGTSAVGTIRCSITDDEVA